MSDDEHDGAPVEPAEEAEDNAAKRPQIQPVPPIRQSTSITPSVNRAPDDLALLHRKVTRILGRSDDIAPIRDNVGNTNKRKAETRVEIARAERTTATSKVKIGKTLSKGNPSDKAEKIPKLDEGMVHIMDQRTIEIKRILEEVYDGLEELYTMHKNLSQTIQDHILSTKSKQASRSPSPGPSRPRSKALKCPFCDGTHFASDCTKYVRLRDRHKCINDNGKCERCLQTANHLATSCRKQDPCFFCKTEKRESEMNGHHSAFCPHKFSF